MAGCGVDRAGPCRPVAAPQNIAADHEEAPGIDRLAGTDQRVPPAGKLLSLMPPGGMGGSGQGVADQDGVGPLGVELAVGLVGYGHMIETPTQGQLERPLEGGHVDQLRLDQTDTPDHTPLTPGHQDGMVTPGLVYQRPHHSSAGTPARARAKSALRSATASRPTLTRIRAGVTPASMRAASERLE